MGGHYRHGLGKIQSRAAADGDHAIAFCLTEKRGRLDGSGFGRVARGFVEHGNRGNARCGLDTLQQAKRTDTLVGDDDRAGDPRKRQFFLERCDFAVPELDPRDVVDQAHRPPPALVFPFGNAQTRILGRCGWNFISPRKVSAGRGL